MNTRLEPGRAGPRAAGRGASAPAARQGRAANRAEAAYTLAGAAEPELEELLRLHALLAAGDNPRAAEVRRELHTLDQSVELPRSAEAARERWRGAPLRPTPATGGALPSRGTSFIGRREELDRLKPLLLSPDGRLVTLVGPAGVGKTRLALQAARELAEGGRFARVHFVPLETFDAPERVPAHLAAALGIEPEGSESPRAAVARALGREAALLVLDNLEHLVAGAGQLGELLEACPNLTLLATSRERLALEEEQVFPVVGLRYPRDAAVLLEEAGHFHAVRLFLDRARRVRPDFRLGEPELEAVLRLCRLVDGLPLGLELAAAWVRAMPVAEIAGELERNLDLLSADAPGLPERHRSLRAALAASWNRLGVHEQEALRRLAVFRGGFRREAATSVAGATIPLLAALVDKSLLAMGDAGLYELHPLVSQYLREKLDERPSLRAQSEERHAGHYLRRLEALGKEFWTGRQRGVLEVFEGDLENTLAAWRWALGRDRPLGLRPVGLTLALVNFLNARRRFQKGTELLAELVQALPSPPPDDPEAAGENMIARSWLAARQGRHREALELAHRGLERLRPLGRYDLVRDGLIQLSVSASKLGDYHTQRSGYEESLGLARAQGDEARAARILTNLSLAELSLGHHARARERAEEALELHRHANNQVLASYTLRNLAMSYLHEGHLGRAEELLKEARGAAEAVGFRQNLGRVALDRALVALELGEPDRAWAYCEEALVLAYESGMSKSETNSLEAKILVVRGRTATGLNQFAEAYADLMRAAGMAEASGELPVALGARHGLAELWASRGDDDEAARLLGSVVHHPSAEPYTRDRARRLLEAIGALEPAGVPPGE